MGKRGSGLGQAAAGRRGYQMQLTVGLGRLGPGPICAPAIRVPALRRDKPMHLEHPCRPPGLPATADLAAN